jgi:predicted acylesterase/phospholipase RssA
MSTTSALILIADFWIPFFANSTNITHSKMEVHRTGYAWYVIAIDSTAGCDLSDHAGDTYEHR